MFLAATASLYAYAKGELKRAGLDEERHHFRKTDRRFFRIGKASSAVEIAVRLAVLGPWAALVLVVVRQKFFP
jgi:hypothetical protein